MYPAVNLYGQPCIDKRDVESKTPPRNRAGAFKLRLTRKSAFDGVPQGSVGRRPRVL
jgi:hypothetical protein